MFEAISLSDPSLTFDVIPIHEALPPSQGERFSY